MKHLDLVAGNNACTGDLPGSPLRRRLLLSALGGGALMASKMAAAESKTLIPGQVFMGARILQRVNEVGIPDMRPDNFGPMTLFVFPVAVAVSPMQDIYIADAGLSAVFRYDPAFNAMVVVRGARVSQQTRLAALSDGSVLVANGGALPATRFSRTGRVMAALDPRLGSAYYDEVAVESASGRYYGIDKIQRRVEEIMPHGRGATLLPEALVPELPTAMAVDGNKLFIAGQACQCVVAVDLFGSRDFMVVAEDLGQVSGLAAGNGWLAIADSRDQKIRLYREGILRAEETYTSLGLLGPRGMSIAYQTLYIADTASRRIVSFRLRS